MEPLLTGARTGQNMDKTCKTLMKTSNNNYTLNHTATVFMIDELGNFRGTIFWGENKASIIQKINNLRKLN